MKTKVNALLVSLILLDASLTIVALFFPAFWIELINGVTLGDPLGLVGRLGGGWAAFFLLQLVALTRWRREPHWLAVVAGVRGTELFADWAFLYFAQSLTWFGKAALFLSPLVNALAAWYFLKAYRSYAASAVKASS